MFDTTVTIVGNALNVPEWRRLKESQVSVAHFKVAATSRRYDRRSDRWVDGPSLRVRVNCWRRLADNVGACVNVGDPVIVTGRLYSRDWMGDDQIKRVSYEMDAYAVGHDLSRGQDKFTRHRPGSTSTHAIEDEQADRRINGELSEPVIELNSRVRRQVYDEDLGGLVTTVEDVPAVDPFDGEDPFDDPSILASLAGDAAGSSFGEGGGRFDPDEAARAAARRVHTEPIAPAEPMSDPDTVPGGGSRGDGDSGGVPAPDGDPDGGSSSPDDDSDSGSDSDGDSGGGSIAEPGRRRRRRVPVPV